MSIIAITQIIESSTNVTLSAVAGKIQRVVNTGTSDITVTMGTGGSTQTVLPNTFIDFWYENSSWRMSGDFTNASGWIAAGETWTYASADSPSFTFTISGDKTGKYSAGMKIRLTQTTVKYFIITAVSYSGGSGLTTITLYGGTDYTLANAAITSPYYSMVKAPYGFPMNPEKWTVSFSETTLRTQSAPSATVYYNLGSRFISIPVGAWDVIFKTRAGATAPNAYPILTASLSTASSSEGSEMLTGKQYFSSNIDFENTFTMIDTINITAKTTYYAVYRINYTSTCTSLDSSWAHIKAVCKYL